MRCSDTTTTPGRQVITSLRGRDERAARALRLRMALLANEAREMEARRQRHYQQADDLLDEIDQRLLIRTLLGHSLATRGPPGARRFQGPPEPERGSGMKKRPAEFSRREYTGGMLPDEPLRNGHDPGAWNDPDWSLLDDRRGALPDFPLDVLTEPWRAWLQKAARGAGSTPAHVMVPFLAIASGLVGAARRVRASSSWSEPLTNWTAIVGASGTSKTPGLEVTRRALMLIERSRKSKIAKLLRAHERRVESAKAAEKKWKADVQAAVETGGRLPDKPPQAVLPGEFMAPRLYVSNVTIERLTSIVQHQPRGAMMIGDELAGLFLNMGRYSNIWKRSQKKILALSARSWGVCCR